MILSNAFKTSFILLVGVNSIISPAATAAVAATDDNTIVGEKDTEPFEELMREYKKQSDEAGGCTLIEKSHWDTSLGYCTPRNDWYSEYMTPVRVARSVIDAFTKNEALNMDGGPLLMLNNTMLTCVIPEDVEGFDYSGCAECGDPNPADGQYYSYLDDGVDYSQYLESACEPKKGFEMMPTDSGGVRVVVKIPLSCGVVGSEPEILSKPQWAKVQGDLDRCRDSEGDYGEDQRSYRLIEWVEEEDNKKYLRRAA